MNNKSDLQETYEKRIYNLRKKFETYQVVEFFLSTGKRKGTQEITLYKTFVAETAKTTNLDVLKSATERKNLILKFLRENLGNLEDIECT